MPFELEDSTTRRYYLKAVKEGFENTDVFTAESDMTDEKTAIAAATDGLIDTEATAVTTLKDTAKGNADTAVDNEDTDIDNLRAAAIADMETAIDASDATDKETLKTTLAGYINTIILDVAGLKGLLHGYFDSITMDAAGLKADVTAAVDGEIPDTLETETSIPDILDTVDGLVSSAIITAKPNICGRCNGEGRYPKSQDTGNELDTNKIHCKTCDGFGSDASAEAVQASVSFQEQQSSIF